jgi:hypothetical protein
LEEFGEIQYFVTATDNAAAENTAITRRRTFAIEHDAVVDDFEQENQRWYLHGWYRSEDAALNGSYGLQDRRPGEPMDRERIAQLQESWNFGRYDRARLVFRERHEFDIDAGEEGYLQVFNGGGWFTLLIVEGSQPWWAVREIDLTEFCEGRSVEIYPQFVTYGPQDDEPYSGWMIDDIELHVGNIVGTDEIVPELPVQAFLSLPAPNPTNGFCRIEYGSQEDAGLLIYDLSGRPVFSRRLSAGRGNVSLALDELPTGLYMLKLVNAGDVPVRRVLLVK